MAKKTKSFSHIEAQDALEKLNESKPSGEELIYSLLRMFCGYGDGNIKRIRDGVGNKAKDGRTVLIPNLIAYRPKGELDFYDEIKDMQADKKIIKHTPRLFVVSDGSKIVALDPKEQDIYENEVGLLWKDFEFFCPLAGIEKIRNYQEAEADIKSAELMAKIFDEIRRHNDIKDKEEMHNLNIFMSRLLFCYFAEDTNLFPEQNLFTNAIMQFTAEDGHDLAEFIDRAFFAMSTDNPAVRNTLPKQFSVFPYVNGGLFKERIPIPVLSRRTRVLMIKCGDFDWKDINPDIFGSMIQAVVTPEMRAGLGMHYTSVTNIEKLIYPLFLDELRDEFNVAKDTKDIKRLRRLLARLGKIKLFDPACGSGNFLIVTYKRIRELEIEIWEVLRKLGESELPMSNISLQQFYGIEIDDFACDTATLSLWLAEHQMNNKFYSAFNVHVDALPLRPSGHIVCQNACRVDWNTVCPHTTDEEVYVMGNPPYVGSRNQNVLQKQDMKNSFNNIPHGVIDYIGTWFYNAAKYLQNYNLVKAAFVSTNSITQGIQVAALWPPILKKGIEIFFAYPSFLWNNNARNKAAVFCVIIGIRNITHTKKLLYVDSSIIQVDEIPPSLDINNNIIIQPLSSSISNLKPLLKGSLPADDNYLTLYEVDRNELLNKYPITAKWIKPFIGSQELLKGQKRYCLWIPDEDYEIANQIPELKFRFNTIRELRLKSKKDVTRLNANTPYKFTEDRFVDKKALLIPVVSSARRRYIPMDFIEAGTVVYYSSFAMYDGNLLDFAIITSFMHMLWVNASGGRLKNDYRYSTRLCYNTFPFPTISESQKAELEELAQEVLDIRDEHFDMTLGEMYNPETMPDDLKDVHRRLDLAVERCYRLEPFTSDEERLECLFNLYVKMTKK